ncbi:MAG: hypothetical protein GXY76_21295 [Chloroflexi bacterium]|nr:hypothetical protein [Chloroflexota bacterium]
MIGILLRAKALIWKNTLFRRSRRQQLGYLAFLALVGYMAVGIFRGITYLFTTLQGAAPEAASAFLTSVLAGLVTIALFWGLGSTLGLLYTASDLELLMSAPVPPLTVYALKLLESVQSLLLPSLLSLSCLVAYGVAIGAAWPYYLLALLGFVALLLLLSALSMLAVMLVVRFLPAQRTREIWLLLFAILTTVLWGAWTLTANNSRTNMMQQLVDHQGTVSQVGRALAWSPSGWLARAMTAWPGQDWAALGLNLGLLLVVAAVAIYLGYAVYQRAFYLGWSRLQEQASRRPSPAMESAGQAAGKRSPMARALSLLPIQVRGIVSKDWTELPRDMSRLSRLFLPIMMGVVYVYSTASSDLAKQLPGSAIWMSMALMPLVPFFMTLYQAVVSVAAEGRNMGLLALAPLSGLQVLWAKFWSSLGPTLLIAEVTTLVAALVLGATPGQVLLFALAVAWFTVGFVAIGIGIATLSPNFAAGAGNRRQVGVESTYLAMILSAAYWVVHLALITWLLLKAGPALTQSLLSQLVLTLLPDVVPYLDTAWPIVLLIAAEVLLWGAIAYLWRRGARWIERWEITALGQSA